VLFLVGMSEAMSQVKVADIENKVNPKLFEAVLKRGFDEFRPSQSKSIQAGLFDKESLLVCTPTGSGKTMVAEMAAVNNILNNYGKAIYIVPLKALASEKFKEFQKRYGHLINIALSIGDSDSADNYLAKYDLIFTTSEKLDSLIRHGPKWLKEIGTVIVDEIHLLNDAGRGPTLEIVITILRQFLSKMQLIGLSATIGNPQSLATWLDAKLIEDDWRPVKLKEGIYMDGTLEFVK
jgi:helicase